MSEWRETTLGKIALDGDAGFVDGPFGSNLPAKLYTESGIPVIRGSNLTLGPSRFDGSEFVYVAPETAKKLERSLCMANDIAFTKKGTLGQTGLVPDDGENDTYLLSSNQMRLRVDPTQADALFVYYYVSSPSSLAKIIRDAEATGVPKTNLTYLRNFPITMPDLQEQMRIAHILGTLDDKIELNRQMNRTLEAIARAIFKSWFVDFDPVHAKAESREPVGMAPEIAALFPDSFHDSPLGKIPKGWDVSTVGKEFELTMGQSPPGSTYNEDGGGLPFFQGRRDFGFRFPTQRVFCTAPKRIAEEGDTLVSVRAPVGDVNMAPVQLCLGRGLAGVRHNSGSRSYTYYSMLSLRERFREYESEGTVFGAINKSQFAGLDWITPPADLVKTFDNRLYAVDESIRLNEVESRHLASVRDMLLPRLLSGGTRLAAQENVDAND